MGYPVPDSLAVAVDDDGRQIAAVGSADVRKDGLDIVGNGPRARMCGAAIRDDENAINDGGCVDGAYCGLTLVSSCRWGRVNGVPMGKGGRAILL